jgi:hypothetical protein
VETTTEISMELLVREDPKLVHVTLYRQLVGTRESDLSHYYQSRIELYSWIVS